MAGVIQAGNTIRLTCKFYDPNGYITTPTVVRLTFYDYRFQKITDVNLSDADILTEGTYYYDYATETHEKKYYVEWYGLIDGLPSIKRDTFSTTFI